METPEFVIGPAAPVTVPAVRTCRTRPRRVMPMTSTTPVVLLHGQPGDHHAWDGVRAHLPSSVRALAWDRPGYGDSESPAGTLEDNAAWLLDRLDREGIREAVLAGHSYGGGVALAAAAMAPERVRGLVSVAGVGHGCVNTWDEVMAAPVAGPMLSMAMWAVMPWLARSVPTVPPRAGLRGEDTCCRSGFRR